MEKLVTENPNATIICLLPLDTNATPAANLELYREAERLICRYLAIPVLELHKENNMGVPNFSVFLDDGLHPNDAGYERLANILSKKLRSYI
jgi:lysophospholipase L1-like esterase